jgi:hypothetical protein
MKILNRVLTVGFGAGLVACAQPVPAVDDGRILAGKAPAGTDQVLVIDADGRAFSAIPAAGGAFNVQVKSARPATVFVVGQTTRVLRVPAAQGALPSQTSLPTWTGTVNVAQMSVCDCNEDGVDEEVAAEDNPLDQIDCDDDGSSDLDDSDDDGDDVADSEDSDDDNSGEDDSTKTSMAMTMAHPIVATMTMMTMV